ncbi:molybdate ABC transporter substrate-binding protein [Cytobacillus kochii]|uniref:molybdate ABC transporter substrate-binding protein n=1 Tax=Cytobacillus kochii TaxID=859143 RepID=UPI00384AF65A
MLKHLKLICLLLLVTLFTVACSSNEGETALKETNNKEKEPVELTISAAASLQDAMSEIDEMYAEQHPETKLTFNFGGSGSLQQQISQGAPVDLFFSAAEDKFDILVEEGNIAKEDGVNLLGNSLVLITPADEENLTGFTDLTKKEVEQISLGTPESVPAGAYGVESLENMGLWNELEAKTVYAKDVRQVLSYVETGNVNAGIVYKTDALASDKVEIIDTAGADTHTPIIYPVGIVKDTKNYDAAKEFYTFLQSDEALKVFEEYGFTAQ